ncbi:MAG: hypothetical protein HYS66_04010 [Deltaproteobacteria bacterium]|nr:hypothetical protein [Deltaproteobacteria bacterium]
MSSRTKWRYFDFHPSEAIYYGIGGKFSLRDYHDKLLNAGSISLPLVERRHFIR